MSTSEAPNIDPVQSSSSSTSATNASTTANPVASGAKRRRDTTHEMCDLYNTEEQHRETQNYSRGEEVDHELKRNVSGNEAPWYQDPEDAEQSEEEITSPERKRKLTETLLPVDNHLLGQECTQDSSVGSSSRQCSQELNIHSEIKWYDNSSQDYTPAKTIGEPSFLNSLQREETFGNWMHAEGRTSTQKSFKHLILSREDNEKENGRLSSYKSPTKHSPLSPLRPLSNHNWIEPKILSPRKRTTDQLSRKADEDERPDSQWTKRSGCPGREADEDSLTTLFTQDSEGFRVIAHRGRQARNPLKDQTNLSFGTMRTTSTYKSLVEEDEEEMLFTQDSQGNVVIKHWVLQWLSHKQGCLIQDSFYFRSFDWDVCLL